MNNRAELWNLIIVIALAALFAAYIVLASQTSSTNYAMPIVGIAAGGANMSSQNFATSAVIGTFSGNLTSANYANKVGFFYATNSGNPPVVSLVSPANKSSVAVPVLLRCSVSAGVYIKNVSLYTNFSGAWKLNATKILTGNKTSNYVANFTKSALGSFRWNCLAYDNTSTMGWASSNWTFKAMNLGTLNISIFAPANNTGIARYSTFYINGTIRCIGSSGATCGSVYAIARYNQSGSEANTKISKSKSAIPAYFKEDAYLEWDSSYAAGYVAYGVAVDSQDNVIVTGYNSSKGYVTVKYNRTGILVWTQTYSSGSIAYGVAVDSQDNIIVTGYDTSFDYRTVKYSKSGGLLWNRNYAAGVYAYGVAVDSQDNVIITGRDSGAHYHTVKYNSSGGWLWNTTDATGTVAYGVAVDSRDNIIITGYGTGVHYRTVKYNSSGGWLWNTTDAKGFTAYGVAVDSQDSIIITGRDYSNHYRTVKYNSSGGWLWNRTYAAGFMAYGVAVDSQDNIVLTGYNPNNDYVTVKYNKTGSLLWNRTYAGGIMLLVLLLIRRIM